MDQSSARSADSVGSRTPGTRECSGPRSNAVPRLAELASATESVLERLGIARENRQFSPHLTLARIRQPAPLNQLREAVSQLEGQHFGAFTISQFHLYLSEPGASGSVYTKLYDFSLLNA